MQFYTNTNDQLIIMHRVFNKVCNAIAAGNSVIVLAIAVHEEMRNEYQ